MTENEIKELQAGPELDLLIAEKVMGWTKYGEVGTAHDWFWINDEGYTACYYGDTSSVLGYTPAFSTDIAAAYQLEERIAKRGLQDDYIEAMAVMLWPNNAVIVYHLSIDINDTTVVSDGCKVLWAIAHATPEQRCKAALLSLL